MSKLKPIVPLPPVYYLYPIAFLAVSGLVNAIYMAVSHYRVYTDMTYKSFCAISKSINCDTVSQSPYAILMGIPVPVWGIIGYGFLITLLFLAWNRDAQKQRLWTIIFILALAFSIYSILLAYLSIVLIRSYCLMCIVNYALTFLILYYAWLIRKRFESKPFFRCIKTDLLFLWEKRNVTLPTFFSLLSIMIFLLIYFPPYWKYGSDVDTTAPVPSGITENGHPWIGATHPELTITEFTDYRCFQCRKIHFFLRSLILSNPGKIRLVHRHFPMDHAFNPLVKKPYHIGAGQLALLSIFAEMQGKFWEMSDQLYRLERDNSQINMILLAKAIGLDTRQLPHAIAEPDIVRQLMADIYAGIKLGIDKTPGYMIDGNVYTANIPASILKPFVK
jgi:uncharacterized membrane protein/protein-disulfide isomerase